TDAVVTRTVLLLTRMRHELTTIRDGQRHISIVEEALPVAVVAGAELPLTEEAASRLLMAEPTVDLDESVRERRLDWLMEERPRLQQIADFLAGTRSQAMLEDHRRVRTASDARGRYDVRAITPVDVIGVWVLLPPADA